MANVTMDTVIAFSNKVLFEYYNRAKTSVMALNPEDKVYTPLAKTTRIRQVKASGAGDYTGIYENVGGTSTVEFKDYTAVNDRFKQLVVDYLEEMASKPESAKLSIEALVEDFINKYMAGEIDAYAIASWVKAMPAENVFTTATYAVDKDSIWDTLLSLQGACNEKGVDTDVELFTFIDYATYTNMQKYILEKNGLANNAVLTKRKFDIDLGVEGIETITVNTSVIRYNNMTIIPMQSQRMNTEITLFDGKSDGQTAGGWAVSEDAKKVHVAVLPAGSGFVDTRYQVLNFLVPAVSAEGAEIKGNFDGEVTKVLGDVVIQNIGINQTANAYEVDFRCVYNAELFDIKKNACFAITAV